MPRKASLNPIPPTLRGKKRYVKFSLVASQAISDKEARAALENVFSALFGDFGTARQKLWLLKWAPGTNEGILRCSLEQCEQVKAGLLFITGAGGKPAVPLVEAVSGSVKKLKGN